MLMLVRCVGALALVLLAACRAPVTAPSAPPTVPAAAIRAARAALGEPAVAVVEAIQRAARMVEATRYDVDRGAPMRAAAETLPGQAQALEKAAETARAAAEPLEQADADVVARAAGLVIGLAELADVGAVAVRDERSLLSPLIEADAHMAAAVAAWDAPGSQADRRAALRAQAGALRALAAQLAESTPHPARCAVLRDNRVRWARLLADRTESLAELATAATGDRYDELRASFAGDPYGEDRLAADAAGRDCWHERATLPEAAAHARAELERLELALQG